MSYQITSYQEAIDFLFHRINYERASVGSYSANDMKLGRMTALLERLGNPQEEIPAIHIAGTKGKGSTATMIANVLTQAGYRTGLFTSPHLHRFEERMVVDGKLASEDKFVALVQQLMPHLEVMDQIPGQMAPTYFEIATALAWLHFRESQVEHVVLETGLGGRLDTTRLCNPLITVITCISLDHTNLLGETVEEIAAEKAGILKPEIPLVTGVRDGGALEVIRQHADSLNVPRYEIGTDFDIESVTAHYSKPHGFQLDMQLRSLSGQQISLKPALPGSHQAENAALVHTVCELLQQQNIAIKPDAIKLGIESVRCPLRIERVQTDPVVILDAAHNIASISALVETLKLVPASQRTVIFACSRDKKTAEMLLILGTYFDRIILTVFETNPRAIALEELVPLAEAAGFDEIGLAETPATAWEMAQAQSSADDLICSTGSFFLAVELREYQQSVSSTAEEQPQPVPDGQST
ncbi:MAG: folylpolyglutamate synthase/dihydrofolate synthase family protein [Planctomycetaceae bacterium]